MFVENNLFGEYARRSFTSAGATIEYGTAGVLFPVESLDATLYQYRDAELALGGVTGNDVIVVTPTSLATSYALTQHPLTAIAVETLPTAVAARLDDAIDAPLDTFQLIQIGKWNADNPDHSLTEFGVA